MNNLKLGNYCCVLLIVLNLNYNVAWDDIFEFVVILNGKGVGGLDCSVVVSCCLLPVAYCLLLTTYCLLSMIYCLLCAYCFLLTTYCLLPTVTFAYWLLLGYPFSFLDAIFQKHVM